MRSELIINNNILIIFQTIITLIQMSKAEKIRSEIFKRIKSRNIPFNFSTINIASLNTNIILKRLNQQSNLNRYRILIEEIQNFTQDDNNVIQVKQVLRFADKFFQVIDVDIQILTLNQQMRQESCKKSATLDTLEKQLKYLSSQFIKNAEDIRSKQQMNDFIISNIVTYNSKISVLKILYQEIQEKIIYTSLDIQTIFDPNAADQQYYLKYQTPLVEVLHRMKISMNALCDEIKKTQTYNLSIKCLNFLVNCKNLILQLQSFLIHKNCVFNRLLSYIIQLHKMNQQHIISLIKQNYLVNQQITKAIQKAYYMVYMTDQQINNLLKTFANIKLEIEQYFKEKKFNEVNNYYLRQKKELQIHKNTIKEIKKFLCETQEKYMMEFLRVLLNEKMKKIFDAKDKLKKLEDFMSKLTFLGQKDSQLTILLNEMKEESNQIATLIRNYNSKSEKMTAQNFKNLFLKIQHNILILQTKRQQIEEAKSNDFDEQLRKLYIYDRIQKIRFQITSYSRTQRILFQLFEKQKQKLIIQNNKSTQYAEQIIQKCQAYLINQISNDGGGNINDKQKEQAENIKIYLNYIMTAKRNLQQQSKNDYNQFEQQNIKEKIFPQLDKYLFNFQALLAIYQSDLTQKILEGQMDQINFESQQSNNSIAQVDNFIKQIINYIDELKYYQEPTKASKLNPKIQRYIKQRIRITQEIISIYEMVLKVFKKVLELRSPNVLQKRQIELFNQKTLEFITLISVCKKDLNSRNEQIQQFLDIPSLTKNFLSDLLQVFISRFDSFIKMEQQELIEFTQALVFASQYKKRSKDIINEFIKKIELPVDQLWKSKIYNISRQLCQIKQNVIAIQKLQNNGKFTILYGDFREYTKKIYEYLLLGEAIYKSRTIPNSLQMQFNDQKVKSLQQLVLKNLKK